MSQTSDNSAPDHAAILAQMAQIHAASTGSTSYQMQNGYNQYLPSNNLESGTRGGGVDPSHMQNIQNQQQQPLKRPRSSMNNPIRPSLGTHGSLRDSALSDDVDGEGQDESEDSSEEGEDDNEDGGEQDGEGGEGEENHGRGSGRGRATSGNSGNQSGSGGNPPLGYLPDGSLRKKPKLTRGSRACTVCRRLKMKCVGADLENNGPCKRCRQGGFDCIFEESNRGKKTNRHRSRKNEAMAQSLKKMEQTLDTVLRSIHNPGYTPKTSGMAGSPPTTTLPTSPVKPISTPPIVLSRNPPTSSGTSVPRSTASPFATSSTRLNDPRITDMDISYIRSPINSGTVTGGPSSTLSKLMETAQSQEMTPSLGAELRLPGEETGCPQSPGMGQARGGQWSGRGRQGVRPLLGSDVHSVESEMKREPSASIPLSPRLHSLPDNSLNPLGLLAEASLQNSHRKKLASTDGRGGRNIGKGNDQGGQGQAADGVGVGNEHYFKPGPMSILPLRRVFIEREVQPEILNILSTEQVSELFDIYFEKMHRHIPVLSRDFHTPSLVCSRSPFLLTAICTIASRFYKKCPDLYPKLSVYAKKLMFDVPSKGYKSVEVVQAYLILTCWCLGPEERFEQDRTWLLLGLAIRTATDLNLQRKSVIPSGDSDEIRAREKEIVNRERCWLLCFVLDRSFSAQLGKPWTIREDYIIRNCHRDSWLSQRDSQDSDLPLSAYVNLQQIMSRALDTLYSSTTTASGLMIQCDYPLVLRTVQEQLDLWVNEWISAFVYQPYSDDLKRIYTASGHFYYSYSCLVLNSFGLQNALEYSPVDLAFFFAKVYHAAMSCLDITDNELAKNGWLQYLPDSQFVMISYAVLSLLKLIRPEFRSLHANQSAILTRVTAIADLLARTAVDPTHTPALYAVLLKSLISAKAEEIKSDSKNVVLANGIVSRPGSPSASIFDSYNGPMGGHGMGMPGNPTHPQAYMDGALPPNALWNGSSIHHPNAYSNSAAISPARFGNGPSRMMTSRQGENGRSGNMNEAGNGAYLSYQIGMLMDPTMAISVPDGGGNTFGLSGSQPGMPLHPGQTQQQHQQQQQQRTAQNMATSAPSAAPTPLTPWPIPAMGSSGPGNAGSNMNMSGHGASNVTPQGTPNVGGMNPPGAGAGFDDYGGLLGMDGFGAWDSSLLMPGFGLGQLELSGGLVHGQWGSGFISPSMGMTPSQSRQASPRAS